ncbi:Blue-light-activated protein [Pseudomonas reidholzensis]|uniref:histidine kinase n=1 Tax=Pseudomonas reidholzensis TaxID=1785162 RepID=A0A383RVE8_9PSED|nr:ATP-binding protein [Pseudomonas reidholzensis]SYX90614.1 Blue-light-activated protein [Pseudomonas reidholzensis]
MSNHPPAELLQLRQQLAALQGDNARLTAELAQATGRMLELDRYRYLFESMEEGFCIIQFIDGPGGPMSDYLHLMANPAYLRHAGLPDVVGRTLRQVIPDEAEVWLKHFGDVARSGTPMYFEHPLYATDRCLGLSAQRIEPADQHLVAVIFRDVTDRKRAENALQALNEQLEQRVEQALAERSKAEEALRQAQKMEAVGQLTGGVAHDFNNLLGGILGALELAEARLAEQRHAALPELLRSAHAAAQRAAALVHRLLAFSRRQTLLPQPTSAAGLVAGMHELIGRSVGPHIRLDSRCAPDLWPVRIDPPQLESALLNLCINARDAMPLGGEISIRCDNVELDAGLAQRLDLPVGDYLCLSVQDTGKGMSAEIVARAIDPFFTTKPLGRGTGLGLSMVYGFVRQSGGQLAIESQPDQGTLVRMFLPRYRPAAHQTAPERLPPASSAPLTPAGCRVVVVEDEAAMRLVIGEVLEELGHQVQMFEDGPVALEGLRDSPRPDLLVSDVGLPGGLNGRQVADALRERHPGLKVLFVTGYDETAVLSDGRLEPGMSVLTKPFTLEALAERVGQMLAG